MTNLQQQVINRAKAQLESEPWFRGVCIDSLPSDRDIERDGVEEHATQLAFETAMWDDPNFLKAKAA